MDEVDGVTAGDKGGMTELINLINSNRGKRNVRKNDRVKAQAKVIPPIICICNDSGYKKVDNLKKDCLCIQFSLPKKENIIELMNRVCIGENLYLDKEARDKIVSLSQHDFRRLVNILQQIYSYYDSSKKSPITLDQINNASHLYIRKETDKTTYELGNRILKYKLTPVDAYRYYRSDKRKIPILIHENYANFVNLQQAKPMSKLRHAVRCIENLAIGDLIDKNMYNSQCWHHLQLVHGITSAYLPSHYVNVTKRTVSKSGQLPYRVARALSRHSFSRTIRNKIISLSVSIEQPRSYNNLDIQQLGNIILYCLTQQKEKIGVEMMRKYHLSIKDLDKLTKIDKLENFNNITPTMKKTIKELLES